MANELKLEIDELTLRQLVMDYIARQTGQEVKKEDVVIQVKSKQNYKSEWEPASFKATFKKIIW